MNPNESEEQLTHREQLKQLCPEQKRTLDLFPECDAISVAQHEKSLIDLTTKTGTEKEI